MATRKPRRPKRTARRAPKAPKTESNLNVSVDPKLIDCDFEFDGLLDQSMESEEREILMAGATEFPTRYLIDRSEWDDRIREHEKFKSSADFFSSRFTWQMNSHECVCHAATQLFETTYNRQVGNKQVVWFSPLALYTRLTGGRRWGGSNVQHSLRVMMSEGMLPEHSGPKGPKTQKKCFKHTVHNTSGRSEDHERDGGGPWIRKGDFPDGWQKTAAHFQVLEAYYIPDRDAHASCLLHGWALSNGRKGHSVPHMLIVKEGRRYLSKYKDSYGVFRYDSEQYWSSGGFCVRAVSLPSNPRMPAGTEMLTPL